LVRAEPALVIFQDFQLKKIKEMAQVIKISMPMEKPILQLSSMAEGKQMVYAIVLDDECEVTVSGDSPQKGRLTRYVVNEALKKMADERGTDGRPLIRFGKYWVFPMRVLVERKFIGLKKFTEFVRMLESAGVTDLPTGSNLSYAMSSFSNRCPAYPNWTKGQMSDKDYGAGFDIARRFIELLDGENSTVRSTRVQ
jgi:hypothetical protein